MKIKKIEYPSADGRKVRYMIDKGRGPGERVFTGLFTYKRPKTQLERNHNQETLSILDSMVAQMILDKQAIGTGYIPVHKLKTNFLDYYEIYVKENRVMNNRHLEGSLKKFRDFIDVEFISPSEITEQLCEKFRNYLLKEYSGETPANYFARFKQVMKSAAKEGYYKISPAIDVQAKRHPSKMKDILVMDEWKKLMQTNPSNPEVKKAAIFSLYTGLRWVDVQKLTWDDVKENSIVITQQKTGRDIEVPLTAVSKKVIGSRKKGPVFHLPTQDGANKVLRQWVKESGIKKHITWHSLRHSLSVLLQDQGTDIQTVAGILGHKNTQQVHRTYQRYVQKSAIKAIDALPSVEF